MVVRQYSIAYAMKSDTVNILCTAPVHVPDLYDVHIDVIPFISVVPVMNDALSADIEALHQLSLNVVFTSANAVTVVGGEMSRDNTDWRIYCIGNATRAAVLRYYGKDVVKGTALNGAQLADIILQDESIKDVVFFCGNKRRDELPLKLKHYGVGVKEVIVYETKNTPQTIKKQYDAILFFSPSAAQSFFSVNTIGEKTVLFAIGETTAAALDMVSNNTIVKADEPDKDELLNEAVQYFRRG